MHRPVETYLHARRQQGAAPGSLANWRWALDHFHTFLGRRPLKLVGRTDIERWQETCRDYSPASRRQMLSTIRGYLDWCERRRLIGRNPARDVRGPRQPRTLPRALAGGAPGRVLLACPDNRARLIVVLMLQEGLRCIEISRLELADIDRQHKTVRVTGKAGHQRVLPLLEETEFALDAYLAEHPASAGPLVRSYTQNRALTAGSISRLVARWMYDAGVKQAPRDGVSAHANRHTMATDMLRNGAHLRDVQAALGHRFMSTTETYLPLMVRGLDAAMGGRRYIA